MVRLEFLKSGFVVTSVYKNQSILIRHPLLYNILHCLLLLTKTIRIKDAVLAISIHYAIEKKCDQRFSVS